MAYIKKIKIDIFIYYILDMNFVRVVTFNKIYF